MNSFFELVSPNAFIFFGICGLVFCFIALFFYILKRIRIVFNVFTDIKVSGPGIVGSIKNLFYILFWAAMFLMLLFLGFFFRAYSSFTLEEPVARVYTYPLKGKKNSLVKLVLLKENKPFKESQYVINGDQWVLEGEIIKMEDWVNFIGIHTRYRLTRIRGRYNDIKSEIKNPPSVYPLTDDSLSTTWKYLYKYGPNMPFINTTYGNAAFQSIRQEKKYNIFVSTSGFVIRKFVRKENDLDRLRKTYNKRIK